jgi:serine/threonine protein kinase
VDRAAAAIDLGDGPARGVRTADDPLGAGSTHSFDAALVVGAGGSAIALVESSESARRESLVDRVEPVESIAARSSFDAASFEGSLSFDASGPGLAAPDSAGIDASHRAVLRYRPLRSGPNDETLAEGVVVAAGDVPPEKTPSDRPGVPARPRSSDTVGEFDTAEPSWSDDATQAWREGSLIAGRYRITGFLGQGGMGKVYVAEDLVLRRPIALKRVPQEILYDLDARDDLRQEANRLLDLAHENIVRVHTYFDGPTWPFFAMEYLSGPTLKALLRDRKRSDPDRAFSPEEVLVIARHVARGLSHAHAHNVVHRDLKPANLMLAEPLSGLEITEKDIVKITDFGISRAVADGTARATGRRSGTLPYMSPEQFLGEPSTERSDVYSFACTLYELLTGQTPFHTGDIGYQILHVRPRSLSRSACPKSMAEAILRALAKRPEDRYTTVDEFVAALEGGAGVLPRRERRRRLASVGTGLIAMLCLAAVVWIATRPPTDPARTRKERVANGSSGVAAVVPRNPLEARFTSSELDDIRIRLRRELRRQFGDVPLGWPLHTPHLGPGEPARDFEIELIKGAGGFDSELLSLLEFVFHRNSNDVAELEGTTQHVRGVDASGKRVYRFAGLTHGDYRLQAYLTLANLSSANTSSQSVPYELLEQTFEFQVDLDPPAFSIRVLAGQLVDTASPMMTFDSVVNFALTPRLGSTSDIAQAFVVDTNAEGVAPVELLDISRGRLDLPRPGVTHQFEIYAVDASGNRSSKQILDLRRGLLELREYSIASVRGNIVDLEGDLVFDGSKPPRLEFFVNGNSAAVAPGGAFRFVESLDGRAAPSGTANPAESASAESTASGGRSTQPFRVSLILPVIENEIEVRYRWNDGDPRPFATPAILREVSIPLPQITLGSEVPTSTKEGEVALSGRISPFFDGLEVQIDHVGWRTARAPLRLVEGGAEFTESVKLLQNQVNQVTITPWYRNAPFLGVGLPPLKIRHDEVPPECHSVELLESLYREIRVDIIATEPLSALSGRVSYSASDDPTFYDLPLLASGDEWTKVSYKVRLPFDYREGAFIELKMRDVAGNANSARKALFDTALATTRVNPEANATDSPASAGQSAPRPILARSEFLRDHGILFVSYGSPNAALEISRTELPRSAWEQFLAEKRGDTVARRSSDRLPMVIGDSPISLVRDFVAWFETKAGDGYTYAVPTVEQWLCAFADADDAEAARAAISRWFDGEFRLAEASHRYGINEVYAIGSRKTVETPRTGLLDMEANVQELVLISTDPTMYGVIGGNNQHDKRDGLSEACLRARMFDPDRQELQGRMTGLRLGRRPRASTP